MKLFIKNMVSIRCKLIVRSVLENLGLHYKYVQLGEAEITGDLTEIQLNQLKDTLFQYGLELMEDKKSILVEKIKNTIIEMIHYSNEQPVIKFSIYLSEKLDYDYTYLSNLFSEVRGTTIEHYIISNKIERAKELLVYTDLTLSEISRKLHYHSVPHLSNQFKRITGLSPSDFKRMKKKKLIALDNL
ncbi:MAG TPA: helix-turn-helix domain-containing protein [Chitinophagaceae bacterium]|nr:helix-turn-helix domain-containing protein [Chitinophagaceae bacterium]